MKKATAGLALAVVAIGAAGSAVSTSPARAEDAICVELNDYVYVVDREPSGTTLMTASEREAKKALDLGFVDNDDLWVSHETEPGLTEIHRMYRNSDFVHVPASQVEKWKERRYTDQGMRFFASEKSLSCTRPVHLMSKGSYHRQAFDYELSGLERNGWKDEGVSFYAKPAAKGNGNNGNEKGKGGNGGGGGEGGVLPAPELATRDQDGVFSIAVLPDTQNEVLSDRTLMEDRNKWLVNNAAEDNLDLRAVLQVGDLVNWDTPEHEQYVRAKSAMSILDGKLPWIGAVGNHDSQATGEGGSARLGTNIHEGLRDTTVYNKYFDASEFDLRTGTYAGSLGNNPVNAETGIPEGAEDTSTHEFSAGGADWMVITIELWPREEPLQWVEKQVAANPDKNIILLTHDYLAKSGEISSWNGDYGDLLATDIHDRVVKKYSNVKMVLSGHQGVGSTRTETVDGNKVISLVQNYETNSDNLTRLITFDVNKGTVEHTYRSVSTDRVFSPPTTETGFNFIKAGG